MWRPASEGGGEVRRRLDESVQYILPLFHIVRVVQKVPKTLEELRELLSPMSPVVEQRLNRLFFMVKRCMEVKEEDQNKNM